MRGRQRLLVNLDLVNEEPTVTVGESGSSGDFRGSGDGLGGEEGDNRGFGEIRICAMKSIFKFPLSCNDEDLDAVKT
ncbi:hypothetical protein U1Q18_033273 [Sarracenia purpurea var. burkii]